MKVFLLEIRICRTSERQLPDPFRHNCVTHIALGVHYFDVLPTASAATPWGYDHTVSVSDNPVAAMDSDGSYSNGLTQAVVTPAFDNSAGVLYSQ
ncbi:MAG: hypothetical protein CM1200mP41_39120 [Gammaproteobacteria bacterium]|nr:MAG: hypothetical protein CM1200mP41_39120 [Gammaproteobacteria bacterium]